MNFEVFVSRVVNSGPGRSSLSDATSPQHHFQPRAVHARRRSHRRAGHGSSFVEVSIVFRVEGMDRNPRLPWCSFLECCSLKCTRILGYACFPWQKALSTVSVCRRILGYACFPWHKALKTRILRYAWSPGIKALSSVSVCRRILGYACLPWHKALKTRILGYACSLALKLFLVRGSGV